MFLLTGLILFILGGVAWRVRGQSEPWDDTVSRYIVWGVPVGLLILAASHNPIYALFAVPAAGLGASLGYWGNYDFTVPGNWNIKNYIKLTLTGMFRMLPLFVGACAVKDYWHVLPAVLAGALFVPAYMVAAYLFKKIPLLAKGGPLFNQFTCYAEFLFGGSIYAALAGGLFA